MRALCRLKLLPGLLLLLLALALSLTASAASALKPDSLYVSVVPCEDGGARPRETVKIYSRKEVYYLFLPGGADLTGLRLWYDESAGTVMAEGGPCSSGSLLPDLTGKDTLSLDIGKKHYEVKVQRGSGISAMFITTESGSMTWVEKDKENKEPGAMTLLQADGSVSYDGGLDYIKMRGNTAITLSKKNYGIKLSEKAGLEGMGKAKKWCLISSARDLSLIRNRIVYSMAAYVGLPYTPKTAQVDVYLNGSYNGLYLLCEKIEVGTNRVNIRDLEKANEEANGGSLEGVTVTGPVKAKRSTFKAWQLPNEPEDITGGYIIEYENYTQRYQQEESAYTTAQKKVLVVKSPKKASVA